MNINCFRPIDNSLIDKLEGYYQNLTNPLADLNALMMVAWQTSLGLFYHIDDDGVLFVVGNFEGEYYGWGPPVGKNVTTKDVKIFLDLLKKMNGRASSILYLWEDYILYDELNITDSYNISKQSTEYVYTTESLAGLSSKSMVKFRKKRDYFIRRYGPITKNFSECLTGDCLDILKKWVEQKKTNISAKYIDKFKIEAKVCRNSLTQKLPMSGVVIYVENRPVAFSLGVKHSKDTFNCMFEKTDLTLNGLSILVFSELARSVAGKQLFINAGEDWGVSYLKETKLRWQPDKIVNSYRLSRDE